MSYDDYVTYNDRELMPDILPEGTMMAFNLTSCPTGWSSNLRLNSSSFAANMLAGKTIVDRGTYQPTIGGETAKTYNMYAYNGYSSVAVNIREIPPHSHEYYYNTVTNLKFANMSAISVRSATTTAVPNAYGTWPTFGAGGTGTFVAAPLIGYGSDAKSHENRQPYMAFLYCRKT